MKVRAMFTAVLPATAAVLALSASGASATTISGAVHHAAARKSSVVIRKIWYNSPGSDTGSNASLNHEWVKLHNRTGFPVTMTGWTLRDAKNHVFTFGDVHAAGAFLREDPHGQWHQDAGKPLLGSLLVHLEQHRGYRHAGAPQRQGEVAVLLF